MWSTTKNQGERIIEYKVHSEKGKLTTKQKNPLQKFTYKRKKMLSFGNKFQFLFYQNFKNSTYFNKMVVNEKPISNAKSILFKPIKLGSIQLPNRIIMAPLTRCRADHSTLVPNKHMVEYYKQRATAGLIITEATAVTPTGIGYWNAPGIWSMEQVNGWKKVTEAVHAAGGRIFLQIWHVGRSTDAGEFAKFYGGKQSVSSSTKPINGEVHLLRPKRKYPAPRALETDEIGEIVENFRLGAENAKLAGFDGVELHGANGYLIDQFLQDSINQGRNDQYGGSIENRARFLMEIVDAVSDVWGPDRVGVHLSPRGDYNDAGDSDPKALFTYVAKELGKRKVAFICVREHVGEDSILGEIKKHFNGPIIGNEGMSIEQAEGLIENGTMDAVAFGRFFIANPDLVHRISINAPFNSLNFENLYTWGPEGYSDYPTLEQINGQKKEEEFEENGMQKHKFDGRNEKNNNKCIRMAFFNFDLIFLDYKILPNTFLTFSIFCC